MRLGFIVCILSLAAAGAGCELVGPPDGIREDPLTALPRALTAGESALIRGSNAFAFALLREVDAIEAGANHFISPLSASLALGMTANGASGTTLDEMRTALGHGDLAMEDVNASYRSLIDLLRSLDSGIDMRIANALWMRKGIPFHEPFLTAARDYFDATADVLDFEDPQAPGRINGWVREHTGGKIEEIVERIDDELVLYLINAIYFKGNWTTRFERSRTSPAPFRPDDGASIEVAMMHAPAIRAASAFDDGTAMLDLPYGRGAFSMTLVLPARGTRLTDFVQSFDEPRWKRLIAALEDRTLDVYLPRFRMEYEASLNEPLQALGMRQAFDDQAADFSNLSPHGEDMYVSKVKQKTFVEVNEEGTEAAAATSVEIGIVSMPLAFRADRPFLVVIRERLSGTILFIGAIGRPESR